MSPRASENYFNMQHFHDESLKEALKLKMLAQEDTFKKQVQELHHLYQIQMMLMNDNLQFRQVTTKQQSVNYTPQGILQKPLDSKLSSKCYVRHNDQNFLSKGDGWGTREKPVEVESYSPDDTDSTLDEVKLSLSIGGETVKKMTCQRIWNGKFDSVSSKEIIDLEESDQTELSRDTEPMSALCFASGSTLSANPHGMTTSFTCQVGTNKDLARGITRSESFIDESRSCPEQNSLNQGVSKWIEELPGVGIQSVTKESTSCGAYGLDLNKPAFDESTFDINDLAMEPSTGACSGVTERTDVDMHKRLSPDETSRRIHYHNCSNEISAIIRQDTPNSSVMASNSTNSSPKTSCGKVLSPDLDSSRLSSGWSESHHCLSGNSQHKDAELGSKFCRTDDKGRAALGLNNESCERNAMPTHDTVEGIDSSPSSCKSDYIVKDQSCSLKTGLSGVYLGNSDLRRMSSFPNPENESCSQGESKSGSLDEKTEGPAAENDSLVQEVATSLMHLSLESSRREHDRVSGSENCNVIEDGKRDHQPQCSLDTFESMVLKLQESNEEDFCISSYPSEAIIIENKDSGVKLRRGRRMKDFQKDILPSLASLSRHEISEDVRILEGVIRSREYKRLQAKMSAEQNWFTPVRSRRSRLRYIGRKYYS